jgi:hypothetical protein
MITAFHDVTQSGLIEKNGRFGMNLMSPTCGQKTEEIFAPLLVT